MLEKVFTLASSFGSLKSCADDDSVDRLSRRYTTFLLLLFAILVSTKQYVGDPVSCWVPAQFTDSHELYANRVCWVSNTYYLPFERRKIPTDDGAKERIGYYQWIPLILVFQATLFYVPSLFWKLLYRRSGINLLTIVDAAVTCHQVSNDFRLN